MWKKWRTLKQKKKKIKKYLAQLNKHNSSP